MSGPIRKFQVFVSATFDDLRKERDEVFQTIMRLRHIPVGMEAFTANPDRGWQVIKSFIDTSDYYVVIVAGRYGSIDTAAGISWTEREYDYAGERGLKRIAFIRDDDFTPVAKTDTGPDRAVKQEKLAQFKLRLRDAHLVVPWRKADDLARRVSEALHNLAEEDAADGSSPPGWVRGGDVWATATELAKLSDENRSLRERVEALGSRQQGRMVIRDHDGIDGMVRVIPVRQIEVRPRPPHSWAQSPSLWEDADVVEYVRVRNRSFPVRLKIQNVGTAPVRDVELRIEVEGSGGCSRELSAPGRFTTAHLGQRTGNAYVESLKEPLSRVFQVVCRVLLVAPGSDAELPTFWVTARALRSEYPVSVRVEAVDSWGNRASASFEYVVKADGGGGFDLEDYDPSMIDDEWSSRRDE